MSADRIEEIRQRCRDGYIGVTGFQYVVGDMKFLLAEVERLNKVIATASDILFEAPELNMCNYNEDQVAEVNSAAIEACCLLKKEVEKQ